VEFSESRGNNQIPLTSSLQVATESARERDYDDLLTLEPAN
jgi:hypothetical protein